MDFYASELYLTTLKSYAYSADKAMSFLEDAKMTSEDKQDIAEGWYLPVRNLAFELNSFHGAELDIPELNALKEYDFMSLCSELSEDIVEFMEEDQVFMDRPAIAQYFDETLWRELYGIHEEFSCGNNSAGLDMAEYWYKNFLEVERFSLSSQKDNFEAENYLNVDFYLSVADKNLREVLSDGDALRSLYIRRKEENLPVATSAFEGLSPIRLVKESIEDTKTFSWSAQEDIWDQYEFNQDIKENPKVMALFKQYLIDWAKYVEKDHPLYMDDVAALRQNIQKSDQNSAQDYGNRDDDDDDDDDDNNESYGQGNEEEDELDESRYYELVTHVEEIYALQRYAQDILGVSLGKIMNYSQSEIDILHKHEYDFGSEDLNLISAVIEDFKEEYDINKTLLNSMSEDKEYEAIDEFLRYPSSLEKHKMMNALMSATDGAYEHLYELREKSVSGVAQQVQKSYVEQYANLALDIRGLMSGRSVKENVSTDKVIKEVHRAVVKTHLIPNELSEKERAEALIFELDDKIGIRSMDDELKSNLLGNVQMYLKDIISVYKTDEKNDALSQGINLAIKKYNYRDNEFIQSRDLQDKLDFCSKPEIHKYEDFRAYEENKSLYEAMDQKYNLLSNNHITQQFIEAKYNRN